MRGLERFGPSPRFEGAAVLPQRVGRIKRVILGFGAFEQMELASLTGSHERRSHDLLRSVLEALQTQSAGHLGVEAAAAKPPVTFFDRAIADDIVGRDGRASDGPRRLRG
jgi:hypothetical protein